MALKILLADDSMTAQNMGKKILVEAGYEVIAVSNGAAAVKKIAEQKPDLVVLDVYMPGYTGLEVCERVKSAIETTKTPVLLTVGKMEPFKPEEGARVKADGVIVKPFEASDLLAAVQRLEQGLRSSKNSSQARVMVTPAQPPSDDETPEYERTLKIKSPIFDEGDASYQSWKSETAEHTHPDEPAHQEPAHEQPMHAQPAHEPEIRRQKPAAEPLSEEDFSSAAAEPPTVNVPTEMQAAPAMGMEHLDSEPTAGEHNTAELERNTEVIERSTSEVNPYKIVEESAEETQPKSGVGRFFSKAKTLFGGATIEDEEKTPKPATPQDESEAETLPPVSAEAELETVAPMAASSGAPPTRPQGEVSDLHLSSVASWESIVPAPPGLSSARVTPAAREPELEVAPKVSEVQIAPGTAPGLEVTSQRSAGDVPAGAASDSLLVTDVSEMSAEFPTRFGVKDAEPVPVGNAADYPELYGHPAAGTMPGTTEEHAGIEDTQEIDTPTELKEEPAASKPFDHSRDFEAQVAAAMGSSWSEPSNVELSQPHDVQESSPSGWSAEETHLEEHEIGVSLHQEMQQQFSEGAAVVEHEPASASPVDAAGSPSAPDAQLAAAMAAAMGTEVTPAITEAVHQAFTGDSTIALDKNTAVIAEIVHRVTERMKPELVAEIARELALEIKKDKQKK